jgi:predicted PhzF superfamily epimerase YddE/YHI9
LLLVLNKLGLIKKYSSDTFIKIEQGDILDRKGRVEVKFNDSKNELTIAGNAVTILKGKLYF